MPQANKILVTGSSALDPGHRGFAQELGRRLMTESSVTLITGGLVTRAASSAEALDVVVANAARDALGGDSEAVARRIMTMLPETEGAETGDERFSIGTVVFVPFADRRTRRYATVVHSDGVIGVGGRARSEEVLDLAFIAGKPLIPIPSTGGAAQTCWNKYRSELVARLNLTGDHIAGLEDQTALGRGVSACLDILNRVLRPRCFVAMPFGDHPVPTAFDVIDEVAVDRGYHVVRVDRERFSGNIVDEVWQSIRHCDVAIIDLTGHRPNVYYEMGIAHALHKPTLLLTYSDRGIVPEGIPFDIRVQRILAYSGVESLRAHLCSQLPAACDRGQWRAHPAGR